MSYPDYALDLGSSDRLATVSEKCIHSVAWPNLSPDPMDNFGLIAEIRSWIWGQVVTSGNSRECNTH